jgi:glycine C-acetyltransferase
VIAAAKTALDRYGLGAASSPVLSGTLELHTELERALADFVGLPDRGVSLFSSGYAVNTGTISAVVHQGHHVVLDRNAHASLLEGAQLSKATIWYFRHNDVEDLERVLATIAAQGRRTRILVGTEGVFSADGDFGRLKEIAAVCEKHDAWLLVDEAHSMLVAGENGRGVAEAQGVLDKVGLLVVTFSKAFGAVGGALIAHKEIAQYVNWYAKCRMFSCAIDPAATAGVLKGLELGRSADGAARRKRLLDNAERFRTRLRERVSIRDSDSWIVPVHYGTERLTMPINDFLQRRGLDSSIMQFPAVPKQESRIRLFVTSEHTEDQLERAAKIVFEAAEQFGFLAR